MLIRALRERHPQGARALYDMYYGALFGTIARIVPDQYQSEDVLQECFLRIWNQIDQYDSSKGRLFTWMVNIARNMAIDRLRSKGYRNDRKTGGLEGCEHIAQSHEGIFDRLDSRLIRKGMVILQQKELNIVDLIYYQGYTHTEVAEALQIPLGTVKTRLRTALQRLRVYYTCYSLQAS
ncbi:RNA polymerase sigma-70 factor, ECF subfamily [Mucilaginibacter gossypiicola]|uniref:RNA polymerase sigma-70 factor, ECF subfamily n=2 Tax=Mucilaginibacter gossypiicola TaxID=551995 RepID=A0A1H8DHE3_9SPHI|nr:RNA polymerase sigma-70 factor, ECF subfamily [Mucilaginibacter gossypiicola]